MRLSTPVETNTYTQQDAQPPYHSSALQKKHSEGFCCGGAFLRCQVPPAPLRLSPERSGRDACFFLFYFQAPCLPFSLSLFQYIIPSGVCAVSLSYRMRDPTAHGVKSLPCPTHMNKAINNSASSGSII